jgi:hypothetical protein
VDHLNHFFIASSFKSGKYSFATVSLYPKGDIELGKNSHHSQVFIICSMIFGTSFLYSSFVYCLLQIQYFAFVSHTHQKIFEQE